MAISALTACAQAIQTQDTAGDVKRGGAASVCKIDSYRGRIIFGVQLAVLAAITFVPVRLFAQSANIGSSGDLEEITVTATRRESALRDAPVAVSAFSGQELESRHLTNIDDLSALVPNLEFGTSYGEARVTIRGIGTNNVNGGADPGVAYHLDGIYMGTTGPAGDSFFDVSRVEILRGPQGTLFGQNATGGAVNLIPNRPSPDASGSVFATIGADPLLYSVGGVLNGPLDASGTLSGRLSATRHFSAGYSENLASDGPRRLDDDNGYGVRGQLLFEPNSAVQLHASVNYNSSNDDGPGYQLVGRGGTSGLPTTAQILGGVLPPLDTHEVYANQGRATGDFLLVSTDGLFTLGPGQLRVLASAARTTSNTVADGDGTEVKFTSSDVDYIARQSFDEVIYDIQLMNSLDVIVGGNRFAQTLDQVFNVPVNYIFPTPVTVSLGGHLATTSYAAFTHATYRFAERFFVFGGARYTYDRKIYTEFNNFVGSDSGRPDWTRVTYEAGVSAKLTDAINAYLKYSTGFKGGGLQLGTLSPPVKPETNNSTEAGLKGAFLKGTLEANLAAFYMRYDDLQLTKVQGFVTGFENAARAAVEGAELEANWRPVPALRVEFNGSLLHAYFVEFESADPADPVPVEQNLAGRYLPNTPRSTASLGAYYSIPVSAGEVTVGGRGYWKDKYYLTEFNLPQLSQSPVARLDLTADFTSRDGLWVASLFARNVTNEVVRSTGIVVSNVLGSPALVTLEPARSVGVFVRRAF